MPVLSLLTWSVCLGIEGRPADCAVEFISHQRQSYMEASPRGISAPASSSATRLFPLPPLAYTHLWLLLGWEMRLAVINQWDTGYLWTFRGLTWILQRCQLHLPGRAKRNSSHVGTSCVHTLSRPLSHHQDIDNFMKSLSWATTRFVFPG